MGSEPVKLDVKADYFPKKACLSELRKNRARTLRLVPGKKEVIILPIFVPIHSKNVGRLDIIVNSNFGTL